MKRSTDRILTTHAGRLDGPPALRAATGQILSGRSPDPETLAPLVRSGIAEIVRRQAQAGIDVISDGELGKMGFGYAYYGKRLSGLGTRKCKPGESAWMGQGSGERAEFDEFYKELGFMPQAEERAICNGPISYIGQEQVNNDVNMFKAALAQSNTSAAEAFMCVLEPARRRRKIGRAHV